MPGQEPNPSNMPNAPRTEVRPKLAWLIPASLFGKGHGGAARQEPNQNPSHAERAKNRTKLKPKLAWLVRTSFFGKGARRCRAPRTESTLPVPNAPRTQLSQHQNFSNSYGLRYLVKGHGGAARQEPNQPFPCRTRQEPNLANSKIFLTRTDFITFLMRRRGSAIRQESS